MTKKLESTFDFLEDTVVEFYVNPDADSGEQIVINCYSVNKVIYAYEKADSVEEFWAYLDDLAKQFLVDSDDENFHDLHTSLDFDVPRSESMMERFYQWALSKLEERV